MQLFLFHLARSREHKSNALEQKVLYPNPIARKARRNSEQSPNCFLLLFCPRFSCEKQGQNLLEYKTPSTLWKCTRDEKQEHWNSRWEELTQHQNETVSPCYWSKQSLVYQTPQMSEQAPSFLLHSLRSATMLGGSPRSFCLSVCVVKTKRLTTGNWII